MYHDLVTPHTLDPQQIGRDGLVESEAGESMSVFLQVEI